MTADDGLVLLGRWGVGPYLPHTGLLVWEDTGKPAEGVDVEFHRTRGVPVTPDPYITRTNQYGTFAISPTPLTSGEVVGELIVRPPEPYAPMTIPNVKVLAVDVEQAPDLVGQWFIPLKKTGE
jgi:hypothetical protein